MKKDNVEALTPQTRLLHWVVALGILGLLSVGTYMKNFEVYSLYPIHKSIGILLFAMILARVGWRILNGWPQPVADHSHHHLELLLSRTLHWVLIIATLLMPISGMLMSALGGHGLFVFGIELFATNPDPNNLSKVLPINEDIASIAHSLHHWISDILIVAIALHIAGAIKHHVVNKDSTLRRMMK